jgi:hypothetical protein
MGWNLPRAALSSTEATGTWDSALLAKRPDPSFDHPELRRGILGG